MRRILLPLGLLLFAAAQIAGGGCSSSSALYGGGGCESFCTKWFGASCPKGPTYQECLADCQVRQSRCPDEANALMRCALLEANIACETGSHEPRIVGCAPREAAQEACLSCSRFCVAIAASGCPKKPSSEECLAACTGAACGVTYQRFVDSCAPIPSCTAGGEVTFTGCGDIFSQLSSCTYPTPPFFFPKPVLDAGGDSEDALGGGFER